MVVACINKYLDDWLRVQENKRISDTGKGDECPIKGANKQMTLSAEGENLKTWPVKERKTGQGHRLR
jgi:hypothetical protein